MGFVLKRVSKSLTCAIAVAMLTTITCGIAPAQERLAPAPNGAAAGISEPIVLVTLGSIDKLQEDVNYIAAAVNQPAAAAPFGFVRAMSQGINPAEPIVVMASIVNGVPEPAILVPTTDAKSVLKRLEGQIGPAEDLGNGMLAINAMQQLVYIKQNANWAVLSRNKDLLGSIPADPSPMLTGMGNDYDLAFRLKMQLVPVNLKAQLIGGMRQGFEQAMARSSEQSGLDSAEYAEATMSQFEMLIEDTDELFFGLNTDVTGKRIVMDTKFTAVEGSKFAKMYGGQQPISSRFANVIRPDAAAYFHGATSIGPEMVEQTRESVGGSIAMIKNMIEQNDDIPAESVDELNEMIDRIVKLLVDSIAEGKSDGGAVLLADDGQLQFVYGAFVSDGGEVAQIAKDLAEKVKDVPDGPSFSFDISNYNGVTMHLIEAAVPEGEDEARKVFGESLKVHVGTAPQAVYIAIGDASLPVMKDLIDSGQADTAAKKLISQARIRMLPILTYAKSVDSNAVIDAMIGALRNADVEGLVTLVTAGVPNGQQGRLAIGEGVLKAVGAAVEAGQQGRARGF